MDYGHLPFKACAIKVRLTTAWKMKYDNDQERSHRKKQRFIQKSLLAILVCTEKTAHLLL